MSFTVQLRWLQANYNVSYRLLEVGAVEPDNYAHVTWINCTPIDLRSRHPLIQEQNLLEMDVQSNCSTWDAISLSLVVNFVPNPKDRGI